MRIIPISIVLICMLLVIPVVGYPTEIQRVGTVLAESHFGGGTRGLEEAPYRISILSESSVPALYPELVEGSLDLKVGDIVSSHSINIVVIYHVNITFTKETGREIYGLSFPVVNQTIEANSDPVILSDEINHGSGVRRQLDNGTFYPISSYYYLGEVNKNGSAEVTLGIYLEQSNHSREWDSEITIYANYTHNGDTKFYGYMRDRQITSSVESTTPFHVSWMFSLTTILMLRRQFRK